MFQKVLFKMLLGAKEAGSPEIVEGIREYVEKMVKRAKETPNPFDDVYAGLLQSIVGTPKEPIESEE